MKKIRVLALVLVLVMLTALFAGCAQTETKKTGAQGGGVLTEEEVDPARVYDAEIKDLGGHEFYFMYPVFTNHPHLSTVEIYSEGPSGDRVNDAVFERNSILESRYNCKIVGIECPAASPTEITRESMLSDEHVADVLVDVHTNYPALISAGLLVDFSEVSTIDLTKAWWDQNAITGLNSAGKVFAITGEGLLGDDRSVWITCFNKDLVASVYPDLDLYQAVRDGKWTIDLMYDIVSKTAADLNGDGKYEIGTDRFGWTSESATNGFMIAAAGLTPFVDIDAAGNITLPYQPKKEVMDVWAKLKPLLTTPYREINDSTGSITQGLTTFYICNLAAVVKAVVASGMNIGYLPMPKISEEQDKYYTFGSYYQGTAFVVPTTVENTDDWQTNGFNSGAEQVAYFLEAFSYLSMNTVSYTFFNDVLYKQSVTDVEAPEMLQIATANKVYDPVFGNNMGLLSNIFYQSGSASAKQPNTDVNYENVTSLYEARSSAARKQLTTYIQAINNSYN